MDETATVHWRRWRDAAERWRPLGVRLGIDNTGRALEALADARSYGVDYLKIDGRFIRGLATDSALNDFARQLVVTARAMGVALYAEGVEHVVVNGRLELADGELTGVLAGRALRRPGTTG